MSLAELFSASVSTRVVSGILTSGFGFFWINPESAFSGSGYSFLSKRVVSRLPNLAEKPIGYLEVPGSHLFSC